MIHRYYLIMNSLNNVADDALNLFTVACNTVPHRWGDFETMFILAHHTFGSIE